jgi:hypothetical protein
MADHRAMRGALRGGRRDNTRYRNLVFFVYLEWEYWSHIGQVLLLLQARLRHFSILKSCSDGPRGGPYADSSKT